MNKYDIVNAERERIIDALFATESHCMFCEKRNCGHTNRTLNSLIPVDTVLRAINLDNYFGTDEDTTNERAETNGDSK